MAYLPEVRPSWFFAVPRIWEKLKAAIEAGIAAEQDPERKAGVEKALEVGLKKVELEQAGEEIPEELAAQYAQADEHGVLQDARAPGLRPGRVGERGRRAHAARGDQVLPRHRHPARGAVGHVGDLRLGTVNPPDKIKIGTVGPPSPGVEIKLADDGEVMVRGRVIMQGYRNQPDKTAETIDSDGWLATGDIGEFDEDGYLKIVDRKKELIINAAGKNMSPANIEAKVKAASPLIGQAIAIGDGKPYNVALITARPRRRARLHRAARRATRVPRPRSSAGVDAANEKLARVEQIKKFKLLDEDWQPGGEELTPTMKLKRKPINAKYEKEIEGSTRG